MKTPQQERRNQQSLEDLMEILLSPFFYSRTLFTATYEFSSR